MDATSTENDWPQILQGVLDAHGWNQSELAAVLQVDVSTVSGWMTRGRNPDQDSARTLDLLKSKNVFANVTPIVVIPLDHPGRKYYILRVMDDSLAPEIMRGDYAVIAQGNYGVGDIVMLAIGGSYRLTRVVNIMEARNILGRVDHVLARAI